MPSSGPLSIPFTFTGDITAGATVDTITGALGSAPVTITSYSGLGTSSHATGSGTLTITAPGTYVLSATDTNVNSGISATTSVTFVVKAAKAAVTISGHLFFDVNYSGVRDSNEYGMAGVTVKLLDSRGRTIATDTTDALGAYSFTSAGTGTYTVSAASVDGYTFTTQSKRDIRVGSTNVTVPDIGYGLYMCGIQRMCGGGWSIGYWKNNLGKCLSGSSRGMQCTPDQLSRYTKCVARSDCRDYRGISMQQACNYLSSNSSDCRSQLAKQLTGCEYNYACGGYINGNKTLTYDFIYFCENVLNNSDCYSNTYVNWVKDWCDAYNNSEGGRCNGPSPKGSDQDWHKNNCSNRNNSSSFGRDWDDNSSGWSWFDNDGWNFSCFGRDDDRDDNNHYSSNDDDHYGRDNDHDSSYGQDRGGSNSGSTNSNSYNGSNSSSSSSNSSSSNLLDGLGNLINSLLGWLFPGS
jgi:hypothetical protein